jgi:DNA-binding response OmpR family regulator
MYRILIVEDEAQMRVGLKDNLDFEGYTVDMAPDGDVGLEKIMENKYDLIILDVMLPKISGFDVCKKVREAGIKTPIMMLTAKSEEIDKVLGLELGADDYVTKPFSLREVLARVKAILRRVEDSSTTNQSTVRIGNVEVNFQTYESYVQGKFTQTTHKEIEILKFLWIHKNQVVSREQLLKEVWGYEAYPTTRTVDNFILKLRQKMEQDPAHPKHILTVHGVGYKLIP